MREHEHEHEHQNLSVHYIIRAGILAAFSLYVVHLVKLDKLQYYIVPKMIPFVKYAAVALFMIAIYFVYLSLQSSLQKHKEADCDCGHEPPRSWLKSGLVYGIFLIPLLLGFAMPDTIMGSDAAYVKGMNLQATTVQRDNIPTSMTPINDPLNSQLPASTAEAETGQLANADVTTNPLLDELFPYDEYTKEYADLGKRLYEQDPIKVSEEGFLEIITAVDLYRNNFIGKTVELSGFIYREPDMNPNQFVVSRIAMTCCSADAMPYGFLVEWSKAAHYEADDWVTVTGVIGLTEYNDNEIIVLDARKITKIDAPKDPYVYPFFGDFAQLVKE
jgi:uncharacterized repeat protein (TIGR03943 family)